MDVTNKESDEMYITALEQCSREPDVELIYGEQEQITLSQREHKETEDINVSNKLK